MAKVPAKVKSRDVTADKPIKKTSKSVIIPNKQEVAAFGTMDAVTAAFGGLLNKEFEVLEKKYEMTGGATRILDRISSGVLVLDLILGGGFTPTGICQMAGMEASGKTTTILHTLGEALTTNSVHLVNFNDAENTMDTEYMEGILGPKFDHSLLASKRFRYSDQNILESYFDYVRGIMRTLPDKIWNEEVGSFVYRLNMDIPKHKEFREALEKGGVKSDKHLSAGKIIVFVTDSTSPQALLM